MKHKLMGCFLLSLIKTFTHSHIKKMNPPFKEIKFGPRKTKKSVGANGTILLESVETLNEFPEKITEPLVHWAKKTPDKTFLARRDENGEWIKLTYHQTLEKIRW